jgi:hypothetical protein
LSANPNSSLGTGLVFGLGIGLLSSASSLPETGPDPDLELSTSCLSMTLSFFEALMAAFFFQGGGDLSARFDVLRTFFVFGGDSNSFFTGGACGSKSIVFSSSPKRSEPEALDDMALNSANKSASSAAPPRSPWKGFGPD